MKAASDVEFAKINALYRFCFDADQNDADEILGFARRHGEVHYLFDGDRITSMLCLCTLENGLKYLFAVATHPDYRNQGLFRKNLLLSTRSEDDIVCIPEDSSLFPFYEKLGFTRFGSVLQVKSDGNGTLLSQKNNAADIDKLYEIYKSSALYPHKTAELFASTIKYHILYKGTIITDGSFYALADGHNIKELCLPTGEEDRLPELVKKLSNGKNTITLPAFFHPIFAKNNIFCRRKKLFALKSDTLNTNNLYINILYN
jgi:ribosomal protein S18 acetylase RimI-like enzyme